jgi:hypothetical protein
VSPQSPEDQALERFRADTDKHLMTVHVDDRAYRHIEFARPETNIYRFDLVTWPGYLAYVGDMGEYLFTRTHDMFNFFASGSGINPKYWSEKLRPGGERSARVFSAAAYRAALHEWVTQEASDNELGVERCIVLGAAIREQLLRDPLDEREAYELLADFEHDGMRISDPYELTVTAWDSHFLWACWAIRWGVTKYRAERGRPA